MSDDDGTRSAAESNAIRPADRSAASEARDPMHTGGSDELNRNVDVIRGILEHATRERVYREVSFIRLAAIVAQIIVGALLVLSAADVLFDPSLARPTSTVVKLLFAGVLQLTALTAFLTARRQED